MIAMFLVVADAANYILVLTLGVETDEVKHLSLMTQSLPALGISKLPLLLHFSGTN